MRPIPTGILVTDLEQFRFELHIGAPSRPECPPRAASGRSCSFCGIWDPVNSLLDSYDNNIYEPLPDTVGPVAAPLKKLDKFDDVFSSINYYLDLPLAALASLELSSEEESSEDDNTTSEVEDNDNLAWLDILLGEFHLRKALSQPVCIPLPPGSIEMLQPLDYYRTTNWTAHTVPLTAYPAKELLPLQSKGAPADVIRDILFARHIKGYQRNVSPASPPPRRTSTPNDGSF